MNNFITSLNMKLPSRKVMVMLLGFFLTFGIIFSVLSPSATAYSGNLTCVAPEASTPPTIDGILSPGEWSSATRYSIYFVPSSAHPPDNIEVFLLHNATALFIAFDVQPDNTSDSSDAGFIFLDLNNNGTQDMRLYFYRNGGRYAYLRNGTNCTNLVWSAAIGFNTTPQESGRNHTIIEIEITINTADSFSGSSSITALPFANSPVGILFSGLGTLAPNWYIGNSTAAPGNPETQHSATTYANLYLGSAPPPFPWWILILAIGIPVAAVAVFWFLQKKKTV